MQGSNFNSSFALRQTLVQANLFSGRPSCFIVFQSFFWFVCFPLIFPQSMLSFFFLNLVLNCVTSLFIDLFIKMQFWWFIFYYSLSCMCIFSTISLSNHSLAFFVILTVLKGAMTFIPQLSLVIKSVYAMSGLTKFS